jgi:hypothetical protein
MILAACFLAAGSVCGQDVPEDPMLDEPTSEEPMPEEPTVQEPMEEPVTPETREPAGEVTGETPRMEAEEPGKPEEAEVGITHFAMRPTAGAVFFEGESRFSGGLLLDSNFLSSNKWKMGLATGALYSGIGEDTDFFGGVNRAGIPRGFSV